jgi:hypothetical protein
VLKGTSSFQALVYTIDYSSLNEHNRNRIIQAGVCTRVAEVFKMGVCTREAAIIKLYSVYKRCSSAQEEQQCSMWSVHKISRSIQAGVCTRGAAVFTMACAQEFQQYSKLSVYKICSSAQDEEQYSIWSVHKRSSSTVCSWSVRKISSSVQAGICINIQAGVCTRGHTVLKLECTRGEAVFNL